MLLSVEYGKAAMSRENESVGPFTRSRCLDRIRILGDVNRGRGQAPTGLVPSVEPFVGGASKRECRFPSGYRLSYSSPPSAKGQPGGLRQQPPAAHGAGGIGGSRCRVQYLTVHVAVAMTFDTRPRLMSSRSVALSAELDLAGRAIASTAASIRNVTLPRSQPARQR